MEPVAKQFLRQSVRRGFALDHGFDCVANAFLVSDDVDVLHKRTWVLFTDTFGEWKMPFGNHMSMWSPPPGDVYEVYLCGEKRDSIERPLTWGM